MAWRLRSDMRLEPRKTEGYVALCRRDASHGDSLTFPLRPYHGMALALFDGRRSTEDAIDIVHRVIGRTRKSAQQLVTVLLRRYRQFFVDADPTAADHTTSVDPVDCLFPSSYNFRHIRQPAPLSLLWVVTEYCDRKCRYCYMNAIYTERGTPPDLGLSFDRVCRIIEEAAAIGVNDVVLSGGEPFLRPDLIDIIAKLVEHRMDITAITKHRITGDRMRRLAATGLRDLHVSLDSHKPETVADLTGVPAAFEDMLETIRGAVAYGIDVTLRPVLTDDNVRDIDGLISLALELGVAHIRFQRYGETCGRHEEELSITPASKAWLKEQWPLLRDRYRDAPITLELHGSAGGEQGEKGCVEGLRGLTFLPNGVATKCEHWRFDDQLVFGDLRQQSLLEVWNSDRLRQVNFPEREAFAGTICYHCKNLPHCHYVRGRCSASALMEYGTPNAPDVDCPIGMFEQHLPDEPPRPPSPLLQIRGLTKARLAPAPPAAVPVEAAASGGAA